MHGKFEKVDLEIVIFLCKIHPMPSYFIIKKHSRGHVQGHFSDQFRDWTKTTVACAAHISSFYECDSWNH